MVKCSSVIRFWIPHDVCLKWCMHMSWNDKKSAVISSLFSDWMRTRSGETIQETRYKWTTANTDSWQLLVKSDIQLKQVNFKLISITKVWQWAFCIGLGLGCRCCSDLLGSNRKHVKSCDLSLQKEFVI